MRRPIVVATALVWLGLPRAAVAGMPFVTLTDLTRARLQVVSFFVLVLLLCAGAVRWIWNGLAADVPRLPRLSFGKACGLVGLWGLLFLLVLTMISGARELLTPGAWEKVGATYRLAEPTKPAPVPAPDPRQVQIEALRAALLSYARAHDGKFPPDDAPTPEVPEAAWQVPDPSGLHYVYRPGFRFLGPGDAILAYEPALYGAARYVLYASGRVERTRFDEIREVLAREEKSR